MCTIIVTIRSVLWAVMTIVGTLMILVALFTNRWMRGRESGINSAGGRRQSVHKKRWNVHTRRQSPVSRHVVAMIF